jgi:hypothetical protein
MAVIDVQPSALDLKLYAGDGIEFRLICTDTGDEPVDITGVVQAQIRQNRLNSDPPLTEFTVGLTDAYLGIIVLSLTGDQTQALVNSSGKFAGVWDVEWEPAAGQPRTLCQGNVECVADVTR